jgi:hypothetical protein
MFFNPDSSVLAKRSLCFSPENILLWSAEFEFAIAEHVVSQRTYVQNHKEVVNR